uniref:Uncharacterized protein n=1 Tax=Lepeophtheirus salmonis TaxID=72036 RepID=A0A0K2U9P9_LEPSM
MLVHFPNRRLLSRDINPGSDCLFTVVSSTTFFTHLSQTGLSKQNTDFPLDSFTGGSCKKSPVRTSCIPPKGLSLLRIIRATASSVSKYLPSTMDISSIIRILHFRHAAPLFFSA